MDGNATLASLGVAQDTLAHLSSTTTRRASIGGGRRRASFELAAIAGVSVGNDQLTDSNGELTGVTEGPAAQAEEPPSLEVLQSLGLAPTRYFDDWAAFSLPLAGSSSDDDYDDTDEQHEEHVEVYCHLPSGVSSWVPPAAELLSPEIRAVRTVLLLSFNPYKPSKSHPLAICGDVSLYLDPELLRPYYCMEGSGASSWDPPPELWDDELAFVPPLAILSAAQAGDEGGVMAVGESSGGNLSDGLRMWHVFRANNFMMQYFVNAGSGEAVWVPPLEIADQVVDSEGAAVQWEEAPDSSAISRVSATQRSPTDADVFTPSATGVDESGDDGGAAASAATAAAAAAAYAESTRLVRSRLKSAEVLKSTHDAGAQGSSSASSTSSTSATPYLASVSGWDVYESHEGATAGHLYYYCPATGDTTWRAPTCVISAASEAWKAPACAPHSQSHSPMSGRSQQLQTSGSSTNARSLAPSDFGPAPRMVKLDLLHMSMPKQQQQQQQQQQQTADAPLSGAAARRLRRGGGGEAATAAAPRVDASVSAAVDAAAAAQTIDIAVDAVPTSSSVAVEPHAPSDGTCDEQQSPTPPRRRRRSVAVPEQQQLQGSLDATSHVAATKAVSHADLGIRLPTTLLAAQSEQARHELKSQSVDAGATAMGIATTGRSTGGATARSGAAATTRRSSITWDASRIAAALRGRPSNAQSAILAAAAIAAGKSPVGGAGTGQEPSARGGVGEDRSARSSARTQRVTSSRSQMGSESSAEHVAAVLSAEYDRLTRMRPQTKESTAAASSGSTGSRSTSAVTAQLNGDASTGVVCAASTISDESTHRPGVVAQPAPVIVAAAAAAEAASHLATAASSINALGSATVAAAGAGADEAETASAPNTSTAPVPTETTGVTKIKSKSGLAITMRVSSSPHASNPSSPSTFQSASAGSSVSNAPIPPAGASPTAAGLQPPLPPQQQQHSGGAHWHRGTRMYLGYSRSKAGANGSYSTPAVGGPAEITARGGSSTVGSIVTQPSDATAMIPQGTTNGDFVDELLARTIAQSRPAPASSGIPSADLGATTTCTLQDVDCSFDSPGAMGSTVEHTVPAWLRAPAAPRMPPASAAAAVAAGFSGGGGISGGMGGWATGLGLGLGGAFGAAHIVRTRNYGTTGEIQQQQQQQSVDGAGDVYTPPPPTSRLPAGCGDVCGDVTTTSSTAAIGASNSGQSPSKSGHAYLRRGDGTTGGDAAEYDATLEADVDATGDAEAIARRRAALQAQRELTAKRIAAAAGEVEDGRRAIGAATRESVAAALAERAAEEAVELQGRKERAAAIRKTTEKRRQSLAQQRLLANKIAQWQ